MLIECQWALSYLSSLWCKQLNKKEQLNDASHLYHSVRTKYKCNAFKQQNSLFLLGRQYRNMQSFLGMYIWRESWKHNLVSHLWSVLLNHTLRTLHCSLSCDAAHFDTLPFVLCNQNNDVINKKTGIKHVIITLWRTLKVLPMLSLLKLCYFQMLHCKSLQQ